MRRKSGYRTAAGKQPPGNEKCRWRAARPGLRGLRCEGMLCNVIEQESDESAVRLVAMTAGLFPLLPEPSCAVD